VSGPIDPGARIGHVHLKVSDLARAEAFYRDVLGFEVTARYGDDAVFMSAGGYHHHIGLNTWHSKGGPPAPAGAAGLFHLASLYPTREALAAAVKRVLEHDVPLSGASDHLVSEAIYLSDPDGNGIELYRDRPESEWPREADGSIAMATLPLDLDGLLAEAAASP
jgi:catechol 2,3-dioxygenase